jgi:hypothetical protein
VTHRFLRRGSVKGRGCPLTALITKLHRRHDPIGLPRNEVVTLAGHDYPLWNGPPGPLSTIVERTTDGDVPFTMWEIGAFPAVQRQLVRLRFDIPRESYRAQIGDTHEFYAYGDAFWLDRIAEDLRSYRGVDRHRYEGALRNLTTRLTPDVFEYLLVSLPGNRVRWKTTPLSYNFSPQLVPRQYSDSVHWFLAHYSPTPIGSSSKPPAAFALKIEVDRTSSAERDLTKPLRLAADTSRNGLLPEFSTRSAKVANAEANPCGTTGVPANCCPNSNFPEHTYGATPVYRNAV